MAKKLICVKIEHKMVNVKNCSRGEPAFAPLREYDAPQSQNPRSAVFHKNLCHIRA